MMGRHHARLLQGSERVEFAGAVDPGGDRYRSVYDPALVFVAITYTHRVDGRPDNLVYPLYLAA